MSTGEGLPSRSRILQKYVLKPATCAVFLQLCTAESSARSHSWVFRL